MEMSDDDEAVVTTNRYTSGAVQSTGLLLDGQMHGAWEFFRKDGSVMRTGSFDRGRQTGVWRTYERSGRLVSETDLSSMKPKG
jgi:antitoxin component YwqK of YwqJK toxin-antitoxin module